MFSAIWGQGDFVSPGPDHEMIAEAVNNAHPGKGEFRQVDADHGFSRAFGVQGEFRPGRSGKEGEFNPVIVTTLMPVDGKGGTVVRSSRLVLPLHPSTCGRSSPVGSSRSAAARSGGTWRHRCWRRSMSRAMKASYSASDRRFLESRRTPFSQLQRPWTIPRLVGSSVPPRLLARMCSSVAPSPLFISKASGPLQIKHLPTQFGPTRRKLESVSPRGPIVQQVSRILGA